MHANSAAHASGLTRPWCTYQPCMLAAVCACACTQERGRAWGLRSPPAARHAGTRPQQSHSRAAPRSPCNKASLAAGRKLEWVSQRCFAPLPQCVLCICTFKAAHMAGAAGVPPVGKGMLHTSHRMAACDMQILVSPSGSLSALHAARTITGGTASHCLDLMCPALSRRLVTDHTCLRASCLGFCAQAKHSQTGMFIQTYGRARTALAASE